MSDIYIHNFLFLFFFGMDHEAVCAYDVGTVPCIFKWGVLLFWLLLIMVVCDLGSPFFFFGWGGNDQENVSS